MQRALDLENVGAVVKARKKLGKPRRPYKVVRGVNGGLTPKARKLRPAGWSYHHHPWSWLAAAYMRHGLAKRNNECCKTVRRGEDRSKAQPLLVEKGMLSDQARDGLGYRGSCIAPNRAQVEVLHHANGETPNSSSIPPLEYRQAHCFDCGERVIILCRAAPAGRIQPRTRGNGGRHLRKRKPPRRWNSGKASMPASRSLANNPSRPDECSRQRRGIGSCFATWLGALIESNGFPARAAHRLRSPERSGAEGRI